MKTKMKMTLKKKLEMTMNLRMMMIWALVMIVKSKQNPKFQQISLIPHKKLVYLQKVKVAILLKLALEKMVRGLELIIHKRENR